MRDFCEWLDATRRLQVEAFGVNVQELTDDERADYFMANLLGLHSEVEELASELGWKPWTTSRGWCNTQRLVDEAADLACFLGNILLAAGATPGQISEALYEAHEKNRRRQAAGDNGTTTRETTG